MNPNEAITILSGSESSQERRKQAFAVLREAAEKRTAKKPTLELSISGYNLYRCPACGTDVHKIHGFCRGCGQAIAWTNTGS